MEVDSRLEIPPEQPLSGTLTPTRSHKSSSFRIASSNASINDNEEDRGGLIEKLKLDKLKIGRRGSIDERRKSVDVGRKLSKLIAPKRRRRKDAEESAESELRNRKEADASGSDILSITSSNRRLQRRDSVASSLLTDEETEYVVPILLLWKMFVNTLPGRNSWTIADSDNVGA